MMIISYMSILTTFICDKICKSYERNDDRFTLVHASKCQESSAMIATVASEKTYERAQGARECSYTLVCQALANAALIVRH